MRSLVIVLTLIGSLFNPCAAPAEEVDSWFVGLDELAQLNEEQRLDYLREMRNIIVGFEMNTNASLPDSQHAMFRSLGWLPEANAAMQLTGLEQTITCDTKRDYWVRIGTTEFCISRTIDDSNAKAQCPKGYTSVAQSGLNPASANFYRWMCYSQKGGDGEAKKKSQGAGIKCAPPLVAQCNSLRGELHCECVKEATRGIALPEENGKSGGFQGIAPPDAPIARPAGGLESNRPSEAGKTKPEEKSKPEGKREEKPKPSKPDAKVPESCKALVPKCDDRESYRADFFRNKNKRACIYGGNISRYHNRPKKFGCEAMPSVLLETGQEFGCLSGVACNPLVFCVPQPIKATKPNAYCVKRGMEATTKCDELAPKDPKCLNDLLTNPKLVKREAWDKFLGDLKKVCTEVKESALFHCKECGIMYRRIFALNSQHFGSLCGKGDAHRKSKGQAETPTPNATTN